ncbi:hypothetical protein HGT73_02975 [Rosenbergiella australiborealis]|uniref:Lipoprotein n=1 Tax=Rosenbergiella australiborealis TaxID=1544696 RepID=A0ABS5T1Y8_9GAMM|nr:hypothetical protein [Rosenbergiella australiborealis]MBT0726355.1 hypothetical protein [Rosenbergiella australiborealis]
MKGHNDLSLAISLIFLSGCQQLIDGVNNVNGAISSSLSGLQGLRRKCNGTRIIDVTSEAYLYGLIFGHGRLRVVFSEQG